MEKWFCLINRKEWRGSAEKPSSRNMGVMSMHRKSRRMNLPKILYYKLNLLSFPACLLIMKRAIVVDQIIIHWMLFSDMNILDFPLTGNEFCCHLIVSIMFTSSFTWFRRPLSSSGLVSSSFLQPILIRSLIYVQMGIVSRTKTKQNISEHLPYKVYQNICDYKFLSSVFILVLSY